LEKEKISFDDYVQSYKKEVQDSINFIGQDVDFFIELKANLIINLAKNNFGNLENIKVLDIGSGIGLTDQFLTNEFKNLYGVDVSSGAVENAKKRNPDVRYTAYDGSRLPFNDDYFDMAFAINVMHHVEPSSWNNFIDEMKRVLKKGGIMAIFEHNPINPLTRLAVSKCEFDKDAVLLSSGKLKNLFHSSGIEIFKTAYIVFFPFKAGVFRSVEKILGGLPIGAQHFIAGKK
jgi:ubiquinone/menaquinone biosynthesis C-methylase UbiE